MADRDYAVSCYHHQNRSLTNSLQAAVTALNTLQSNFAIVDAIRKSGRGMNKAAIPEMIDWCSKIGYKVCGSQVLSGEV